MNNKIKHNLIFGIITSLTFILSIGFVAYAIENWEFNFSGFVAVVILIYVTRWYYNKYIK